MFGTCETCEAVNVRVFLSEREAETGHCAQCIGSGRVGYVDSNGREWRPVVGIGTASQTGYRVTR